MNGKTLILGLGNEILTDDGIGPRLIRDLSFSIEDRNIQFNTACCGGLELLELIRDFERVILIDAIRTLNGSPGEVYHYLPSDFRETMHLSSLHDISFLTALKLGDSLDIEIPGDLHIIAVEIIEDRQFGEELTPELMRKYPVILEKTNLFIQKITGTGKIKH